MPWSAEDSQRLQRSPFQHRTVHGKYQNGIPARYYNERDQKSGKASKCTTRTGCEI